MSSLLPTHEAPGPLLTYLINLLIHPNPRTEAWLARLSERGAVRTWCLAEMQEVVRLGADAGVTEALAYRIVAAIVKANAIVWSSEDIRAFVAAVYREYRERPEGHDPAFAEQAP